MFDTHAHVHDPRFDEDRDEMLARARAAGVERICTVGCSVEDSRAALAVAARYGLDAAIGVHPHEAQDAPSNLASSFDALIGGDEGRPVAIGEIGLDYHYDHSPRERQRAVFAAQLRYARRRGFPVIFHVREATADFLAVLDAEWASEMRGVVHCFTGDAAEARTFTRGYGLRLGIGGVLTFKTAEPLRAAVRDVGLAALLLETDAPYLAPVPHRGKRNEPAFVAETARLLAEVLGVPQADVVARTAANARSFFARDA